MPRRDEFDDDDYLPPAPREARPARSAGAKYVVLGLAAVVVLGAAALVLARTRQARERAAVALGREQVVALSQQTRSDAGGTRPTNETQAAGLAAADNWQKVLGTWLRQPTGPDDTAYPHQFEFYRNMTARVTWLLPGGNVQSRHFQVDVFVDERDQLAVRLHDGKPMFTFQFTLDSDRAIVMRGTGLVFTRP